MRMNEEQVYHNPNCVWSIECHYTPPLLLSLFQQNLFIPSLTDWLTDWRSDRLTDLVIVRLGPDNTSTGSFMSVLLVWSCHRLHSQLGGSSLKLDSQDQRAEEESISIKLKTPVCLRQLQTGKSLNFYGCGLGGAFQPLDGQTDWPRKTGRREGGAEMVSCDFFYGIETSVKCCKYWYICLSLQVARGAPILWMLGLSCVWRMRLQS